MSKTTILLGEINPTQLKKNHENKILQRFLRHHKHDEIGSGTPLNPHRVRYRKTRYEFTLSHTILRRPRANKHHSHQNAEPKFFRYEVVSPTIVGEGSQGTVPLIDSTLTPKASGYLKGKKQPARVAKRLTLIPGTEQNIDPEFIEREERLSLLSTDLHSKKLITHTNGNIKKHWLIMHRLPGRELFEILNDHLDGGEDKQLTPLQQVNITIQCLRELQILHDHGVIHRDLKPENIFYDEENNRAYIYDFGLSKQKNEMVSTECVGSPAYVTPEQLACEFTDEDTDIYAIGKVIAMVWGLTPITNKIIFSKQLTDKEKIRQITQLTQHNTEFLITELYQQLKLPDELKESILSTIKLMTLARRPRLDIKTALEQFELLRTHINIISNNLMHESNTIGLMMDACQSGCEVRQEYRALRKQNKTPDTIVPIIRSSLNAFPDDPRVLNEFTAALGIKAIEGLSTKDSIDDKLIYIIDAFHTNKFELQWIHNTLAHYYYFMPDQKVYARLLRQITHFLNKETYYRKGIDELETLNRKWDKAIARFRKKMPCLSEYSNYQTNSLSDYTSHVYGKLQPFSEMKSQLAVIVKTLRTHSHAYPFLQKWIDPTLRDLSKLLKQVNQPGITLRDIDINTTLLNDALTAYHSNHALQSCLRWGETLQYFTQHTAQASSLHRLIKHVLYAQAFPLLASSKKWGKSMESKGVVLNDIAGFLKLHEASTEAELRLNLSQFLNSLNSAQPASSSRLFKPPHQWLLDCLQPYLSVPEKKHSRTHASNRKAV